MRLIPQARAAWRLASVQVLTVASVVWGAWVTLPVEAQTAVIGFLGLDPSRWMPFLGFVGAIVARLVAQPKVTGDKP